MTRPAVYKQAVLGLRKRHVSETVVMDRIGRRRNRAQAEPALTIPRFALLLIIGGLSWLALFYGFMLIAGAAS